MNADHKLIELYRQHLHARHLTPLTVKHRIEHIERFLDWLSWPDIRDVTMRQLQDYHDDLLRRKKPDGHPVSPAYRHSQVHAVQNFYAFLKKRRRIVLDPFEAFPKLRKPHRLPKGVITNDQVLRWMAQPDLATPEGFRNRAMMEVFYSTGLRGAELCKLTAYEIDVKDHTVRVVMGKGKKDRLVPIGKVALAFVAEYLATVRPILVARNRYRNTDRLFLSDRGTALHTGLVRKYLMRHRDAARLPRSVTVHSLRHACATEMLKGGANVRHVQEMLGHASLLTTQVYTRVVPADLQRIHKITAPSERRRVIDVPAFELHGWRDKRNAGLV